MSTFIIRSVDKPQDYTAIWTLMKQFAKLRIAETLDEIWLLEHLPVFTQGLAGRSEHILDSHDIPVIRTDRGGQVTYHGPGQLMVYCLLDLNRLGISVHGLVFRLEQIIVDYLASLKIEAGVKKGAPGVYIDDAKICSIGLRVRKGYSYHGLALNVEMDLLPFSYINPCGYQGLKMTNINFHDKSITQSLVREAIIPYLMKRLGYRDYCFETGLPASYA